MSQSRDLKSRPTSQEEAIANLNAVVVELEGSDKDIISPTTIKLADWVYRQVAEVIGMIVMADPNALPNAWRRRPRKPQINKMIEQAEKTGKTVTSVTTPDGHTLRFSNTDNASIEKDEWDTDKLQ